MEPWLWYALAAMLVLALSNLAFKLFTQKNAYGPQQLWPIGAIAALAVLAVVLYAVFFLKAPAQWVGLLVGLLALSSLAFGLIYLSLQSGKVALVSAVLSLSTLVVAVLSFVFLGDRFSTKELIALSLAMLSLLFLVV